MFRLKYIFVLLFMALLLCSCDESTGEIISKESTSADSEFSDVPAKFDIAVYICGQVVNPGLYYLENGSRVQDVIDVAGGLTAEASLNTINPASLINDGDKIYVPSEAEIISASFEKDESDGKININTATKSELMTLPGIGESKADSIITYRDEYGSYTSTDEIKNISGIKDGVYEKIKDMIKV